MNLVVLLFWLFTQTTTTEPKWLPPVAEISPLSCPQHVGTRVFRSDVAAIPAAHEVYLRSDATTRDGQCVQTTNVVVSNRGETRSIELQKLNRSLKDSTRSDLDAPTPERSFDLVDSSSDGKLILMERIGQDSWRDDTFRDVEVATISTIAPRPPAWINVWDVMHWQDCTATVEAQGFDESGRVILRVRPSIWQGKTRHDCVDSTQLWAADFSSGRAVRLPNSIELRHNAREIKTSWQTCKDDPDLVAACFTVRARLSFYNGNPSTRLWHVGTDRMLGVPSETLPENVNSLFSKDPWDDEIYGEFEVCPLSRQRPGEMQMVCVSSASHLFRRRRP